MDVPWLPLLDSFDNAILQAKGFGHCAREAPQFFAAVPEAACFLDALSHFRFAKADSDQHILCGRAAAFFNDQFDRGEAAAGFRVGAVTNA